MYARKVQGRTLTFELWPGLERGVLVMRDRETGTLWSQLTGQALDGRLRGQSLQLLPTSVVSLKTWQTVHPDSEVYAGVNSLFAPGGGYSLGQGPQTHSQYVLGTRVGAAARAYPLTLLDRTPVFEDELGGVPIVIGYDPLEGSGRVWDRVVGGQVLHFAAAPSASAARDEVGSTWDLVRGVAVDGPHKGQSLNSRWTTLAYPDNWRVFFGRGSIYGE